MEKILNNPGLQHLAENVFWNLNVEDLIMCSQINQSCNQILQNPIFCLAKFKGLSKENQKDWIKTIQSEKNSDKGIAIISYLKWNLKKNIRVDLPCYSNPAVQDYFNKRIMELCKKKESSDEDTEIIKIFAHLTDNPNAPDEDGITPIHWAAFNGHIVIAKILVPLADNPIDALNRDRKTPLHYAAMKGHTEIVKFFAPLIGNPNTRVDIGYTPIYWAAKLGHTEIVKILAYRNFK